MKVSNNFILQEFIPEKVHNFYGESSIWFLDPKIIELAQFIREYFGKPMTINNWHTGGKFNFRGLRDDSYYYKYENGVYTAKNKGKFSQHRFGRAIDFNLDGLTPDEIREDFIKNEKAWLEAGLTTFEDGKFAPTWCHIDIRNTGLDKLLVVKP